VSLTTRSWKGRTFTVIGIDGLTPDDISLHSEIAFPSDLTSRSDLWAYVNYVGFQMKYSQGLLEAMIDCRLSRA
jgi:hypothetical protein